MLCAIGHPPPSFGRRRLLNFVSGRSGCLGGSRLFVGVSPLSVAGLGRKSYAVALHHNVSAVWAVRLGVACDKGARGRASAVFTEDVGRPSGAYGL